MRKKEYFCALKPTFPMRYTNKKILKITFPVLVCLLMEQLIGLTDTAYLGRV